MNSKFKFNKKYFRIGVCYILSDIYLILGVIKCICKVKLYWVVFGLYLIDVVFELKSWRLGLKIYV